MNRRSWVVAGAVGALLVAVAPGVRAQDTKSDMKDMAMSSSVDYSILNNRNFDYVGLQQAKARGFSDDEVATIAKIAEKTGMPFRDVSAAVLRGRTFALLADRHNLRLDDVMDVSDEKAKIADYMAAYESTGSMSLKHGMS